MRKLLTLVAVAAMATGGFAGEEDTVVVRPGGEGRPYWNAHAIMFLYPPKFDFKTVKGAVKYRYEVIDDIHSKLSFEAVTPDAALTPIWAKLRVGYATVTVTGCDANGKGLGLAGTRTFWRKAPFKEGTYPKAKFDYRECALKILDYQFARFAKPKPIGVNYPTKQYAMAARGMAHYAGLVKDEAKRNEAIRAAKMYADEMIKLAEPDGAPLAHFPPTYFKHVKDQHQGGHMTMLIYPCTAAEAYLDVYEVTKDAKYLKEAELVAETYIRLQGEDGSWSLKVTIADAKPLSPNRTLTTGHIALFERLFKLTGKAEYRTAGDRAFAYLERGPLQSWAWEGQFEDTPMSSNYANLTKHDACSTAIYIVGRYPGDKARLAQARELLRFSEDQFVNWEKPYYPGRAPKASGYGHFWSQDKWLAPFVCEQYGCYTPVDASAAKLIRTYLALYRAEKNPVDLAKARALGDNMTRMTDDDGLESTWWGEDQLRGDIWPNCMFASAFSLEELAADAARGADKVISRRADGGQRTGFAFYQDFRAKKPGATNAVNLFVVGADGKERQLTFGCHIDYCPALSPDGRTVYFSSTRVFDAKVAKAGAHSEGSGIMRVPLAGGEPTLVVAPENFSSSCIDPAPSPDGASLVWAEASDYHLPYRLMMAPLADVKSRKELTDKTMSAHSPRWIDSHTLEFIGYRSGDPGWSRYQLTVENPKALRRLGAADYASAPSGKTYRPIPEVKVSAQASPVPKFEKIALVDSYDYLSVFDLMKKETCDKVVEHVLLTGADTLLWRHQSGGMPRYLTEEEDRSRIPMGREKLRSPYSTPVSTFIDLCSGIGYDHTLAGLDAIRRRGKIAGIHYTMEEAHWSNAMLNQWTLEHPQFWCRHRDGRVWMAHASLAYPEVVEHRLRQLDELLAMGPEVLYVDGCCRCGGYGPEVEFVPPLLEEWKRRYGTAEVPQKSTDPRWIGIVSEVYHNYLRAVRRRLDATGRKIRLLVVTREDSTVGPQHPDRPSGWVGAATLSGFGFDWVQLLKEGTIDGVAVECVCLHCEKGSLDIMAETEKVYRGVKAAAGDKPVYFPIMQYNFCGWKWRPGYPEYAKLLKISEQEAVRRLLKLAKDCGGAGVTLECVDYRNYEAVNDIIRDFE